MKWIGRITEVIETRQGKKTYKIEYADQDSEIMAEQDIAKFIIGDTDDHIGASVVKTFRYKIQYETDTRYHCKSPLADIDDNRWWPKHLVGGGNAANVTSDCSQPQCFICTSSNWLQ